LKRLILQGKIVYDETNKTQKGDISSEKKYSKTAPKTQAKN
jgi:hypothetical protein